jgi:ribosomal-protein-alanine N-acetyltransferase
MHLPLDFELKTRRCRLRVPTEQDIPEIFSATRFAGFNDGMPWDPPASEEDLLPPLQRNLQAWADGIGFSFSIDEIENSCFVGRISIRSTDHANVWNIGFWLHPLKQGRGIMTEAAGAVIDFGFIQLGADAIEACCAVWNDRSRRVLERLGMREVEMLPEGFKKRGEWVKEFRMSVGKDQWKAPNQSADPTSASGTRCGAPAAPSLPRISSTFGK